jgi:hypothetical protein
MEYSMVLALLAGVGVAASCGLRAFLPLLLLGLISRAGWIDLKPGLAWIASDQALWALGLATVLEIAADKIPVVDHALDLLGTLVRPAAAWLGATAVLTGWPSPWAELTGLLLGGVALTVQALKAKVRLGSTAATAGHANPIVSTAEDLLAAGGVLVSVVLPLLVLLFVGALVWLLTRLRRAPAARAPR